MTDKPGKDKNARFDDEPMVSRAYSELKQRAPSPSVDASILAAARDELKSDDTVVRVQRWRKWSMPAALAATVVFAVPLVVRVFTEAPSGFDTQSVVMSDAGMVGESNDSVDSNLSNATSAAPTEILPEPMLKAASPPAESLVPEPPARAAARNDIVAAESEAAAQASTRLEHLQSEASEGYATRPADVEAPDTRPEQTPEQRTAQFDEHAERARMAGQRTGASQSSARRNEKEFAGDAGSPVAHSDGRLQNADATENFAIAVEEVVISKPAADESENDRQAIETQLDQILELVEQQQTMAARQALGSFLRDYPYYQLPANFPLQREDAVYSNAKRDKESIVPEAESWLRGIAELADQGKTDRARIELAKFLRIYRDYPLPPDFPLTREDAAPIDR